MGEFRFVGLFVWVCELGFGSGWCGYLTGFVECSMRISQFTAKLEMHERK